MTVRENAKRLITGEKACRVGLYDSLWPETIKKWIDQGHMTTNDIVEHFGFDMTWMGAWFDNLPKRAHIEVIKETDEWRIARNGAGAVFRNWKNKSGTPEHIDFHMTTREIWEDEYRSYLLEVDIHRLGLDKLKERYERIKQSDRWILYSHMFIWEAMRQSMGDICMFESIADDPAWIHDFNRVYTDFYKMHFKVIFEESGKPDALFIFEDLGYKNGLFCSPAALADMFFPYYREIVDFAHSNGMKIFLHSCGGIERALPLIKEAGFDALNPMEVKAGCDVVKFARSYGDSFAFIGGLDVRILESGDKHIIKKEVEKLVKAMKETGAGYFYGSDHSISPVIEYDDFRYAIDVYKENMYY